MLIGAPKEIKVDEYRVGLIPAVISDLVTGGHEALVETTKRTPIQRHSYFG